MKNYEYTIKNCLQIVEHNDLVLIYADEWRVYDFDKFAFFKRDYHNSWLIKETDINELEKELQKLIERRG